MALKYIFRVPVQAGIGNRQVVKAYYTFFKRTGDIPRVEGGDED